MQIELSYFSDCPNWRIAAERLDRVLAGRGQTVDHVLVESAEQAEAIGFRGSPTIRIDGRDPFARGDEPYGLACRVYVTPDGLAGSPTIEQLLAAVGPNPATDR